MRIQSLGNVATSVYTTTKKNATVEEVFMNTEVKMMDTKESLTGDIYEELASKYNVRNTTFEELTEISKALYDKGEISLKEHMTITFDYERATNNIKQYAVTQVSPKFSMYETDADSNGRVDWIAEFEERANKDFKYGNLIGYRSKLKVLSFLQQLDRQ
ncbi:hypothetical protein [Bacillus sp. T33-2]|uniref:hypothetical protein n=1 Tax=Bacillus sp. T33-2 TaxID=2054168 RepID=UPI000C792477|nr:hypothetical protein [Bacillus sp. T33-2]PLR95979.1 hypothetical protein CVD19_13250 [Bacillus sp. T33-2]